ncbi:MAG: corrinoid protein [Anaerolineae bacterium]|jgi:corrinoid protein of di/trimethylamine methyltransferase|nr:corrinoid protein [Anaerolineae bacterium]MBT3712521.1 corrinoid protein [Anaerolineae bacterium]MBT4310118.1 corrinoid protein [Anaerolineae bacterium]MBT4457944.1 corrinoid protein [Anaerolineae bacterium]MBT4841380.1 corrinoid protein [Anaerolineae bacterium]
MSEIFEKLAQAVIDGEPEDAVALATEALEQGVNPLECITKGLTVGIQKVGELFASGEYFLPELIIGADAMKGGLDVLEPALLGGQKREVVAQVVLGTVEGDLHEIGKTLVGTMLTANGFQVKDIGVDQPASAFVAAAKEVDATIIGASALLTTTMLQQEKLVQALTEAGLRDKVKVMVGGAPVTDTYSKKIGADGYAEDAISAVDLAFRLADAPA